MEHVEQALGHPFEVAAADVVADIVLGVLPGREELDLLAHGERWQ